MMEVDSSELLSIRLVMPLEGSYCQYMILGWASYYSLFHVDCVLHWLNVLKINQISLIEEQQRYMYSVHRLQDQMFTENAGQGLRIQRTNYSIIHAS